MEYIGTDDDDNVCTYCNTDKGESGIVAVTECESHYVSSDQCECPTDQVCFECDDKSDGRISNRILGITRYRYRTNN